MISGVTQCKVLLLMLITAIKSRKARHFFIGYHHRSTTDKFKAMTAKRPNASILGTTTVAAEIPHTFEAHAIKAHIPPTARPKESGTLTLKLQVPAMAARPIIIPMLATISTVATSEKISMVISPYYVGSPKSINAVFLLLSRLVNTVDINSPVDTDGNNASPAGL